MNSQLYTECLQLAFFLFIGGAAISYYHQNYTLYKRGKFYYYMTYTPDGIRTSGKSTHCTNKAQARLFCDDLLKRGLLYSGASLTFNQYAQGFFDEGSVWVLDRQSLGTATRPGISKGTLIKYRSDLKNYLLPFFGHYKLCDLNASVVKKFRQWCIQERELSPKSINNATGTFRLIVDSAMADNIIMFDPMRGIKALKVDRNTVNAFSLEQAKRILNSNNWEDKTDYWMSFVAAVTGMRTSELLAIRTETLFPTHIDVHDQRIKKELLPLKTAENRIVPIPRKIYLVLKELCEPTGYAFDIQQDRGYDQLCIVLDKLGIDRKTEKLKFHSWRHFANTYYLSHDVPKVKVDSIIGHSDGQTKVQAMYTHFKPEDYSDFYRVQEELMEELCS